MRCEIAKLFLESTLVPVHYAQGIFYKKAAIYRVGGQIARCHRDALSGNLRVAVSFQQSAESYENRHHDRRAGRISSE